MLVLVLLKWALVWLTVTESKLGALAAVTIGRDGGTMLLDSHAGGGEGAGDGGDNEPGNGHQDCG